MPYQYITYDGTDEEGTGGSGGGGGSTAPQQAPPVGPLLLWQASWTP